MFEAINFELNEQTEEQHSSKDEVALATLRPKEGGKHEAHHQHTDRVSSAANKVKPVF
jgi:hypothetical protein